MGVWIVKSLECAARDLKLIRRQRWVIFVLALLNVAQAVVHWMAK